MVTLNKKELKFGNYTSQTFANIYLNEVDQYIKHELKVKYYARYLDDSIMIFENKEKAKIALEKITLFVNEKLDMQFNSKTQIIKGSQGINFCGYKINEYRLKIRDRGKRNLKKKVKMLTNKVKLGKISGKQARGLLAGHYGYIKIADVYNLTSKLFYAK